MPDERLREALDNLLAAVTDVERRGEAGLIEALDDAMNDAADLLAAAGREKPDEPHTQDCQDAMFMHHAATGGDMECTCRPPVSDDPKEKP